MTAPARSAAGREGPLEGFRFASQPDPQLKRRPCRSMPGPESRF
jgi:hypothetical protein